MALISCTASCTDHTAVGTWNAVNEQAPLANFTALIVPLYPTSQNYDEEKIHNKREERKRLKNNRRKASKREQKKETQEVLSMRKGGR